MATSNEEKIKVLRQVLGDDTLVDELLHRAEKTEKTALTSGVAFKEKKGEKKAPEDEAEDESAENPEEEAGETPEEETAEEAQETRQSVPVREQHLTRGEVERGALRQSDADHFNRPLLTIQVHRVIQIGVQCIEDGIGWINR